MNDRSAASLLLCLPCINRKGNACPSTDGKSHLNTMILSGIARLFRGNVPKWFLVGVWGPVMTVAAGWLVAESALRFPGGYDWRYEVMCRLGYVAVNPEGSVLWSAALALTCIMGLPCCGYFRDRLHSLSPRLIRFSVAALGTGLLAGIVVAFDGLVHPKLNEMAPKLHEIVATAAFAAIFAGVLGFWFAMVRWLRTCRDWTLLPCLALTVLVLAPLVGTMLSQAYLFYVPNDLGWVDSGWAEKGVPVYLSFAFWEWAAVAAVYFSLYVAALLLPAESDLSYNAL